MSLFRVLGIYKFDCKFMCQMSTFVNQKDALLSNAAKAITLFFIFADSKARFPNILEFKLDTFFKFTDPAV